MHHIFIFPNFAFLMNDFNNVNSQPERRPFLPASPTSRFLILAFAAVSMLFSLAPLSQLVNEWQLSERSAFLITSCLQNLLVFIVPALLVALLTSLRPGQFLEVSTSVSFRQFAGMLIIYILMTPAMNVIIDWNQNVSLPDSLARFEQQIREWEDSAANLTNIVLNDSSVWGLVSGLLVVGLLTGFAEEIFFRAGVQRIMTASGYGVHASVWTAAVIFSVLHFQFFGFVPRMLLGAFFGYLFYYSDSIWVSAGAHALNNSVVVVTFWLRSRFNVDVDTESIGMAGHHPDILFYLSVLLTAAFVYLLGKRMILPKSKKSHTPNVN